MSPAGSIRLDVFSRFDRKEGAAVVFVLVLPSEIFLLECAMFDKLYSCLAHYTTPSVVRNL